MTTTKPAFDPVAVAAALDAFTEAYLPEPPKELTIEQKLSMPQIRSSIAAARDKGMTFREIADTLAVHGLTTTEGTLRNYWRKINAATEKEADPGFDFSKFHPPRPSDPAIYRLSDAIREPFDEAFDDDRHEVEMTPERLAANALITTFSARVDGNACPFMEMESGRGEFIDEVANIIKHAFNPQSRQEAAARASVHW